MNEYYSGSDDYSAYEKASRVIVCILSFAVPASVVHVFQLRQEWVTAPDPTNNRLVGEFFAAVVVAMLVSFVAATILGAAAGLASVGGRSFRRLYVIWVALGGAVYPLLAVGIVKILRLVTDDVWAMAGEGLYLFTFPILLGCFVGRGEQP